MFCKEMTTLTGFEPVREFPNRFRVYLHKPLGQSVRYNVYYNG